MEITGTATEWTAEQTVESMVDARNIIIVPGYGLAVAKGQYPVAEIVDILRKKVCLSRCLSSTRSLILILCFSLFFSPMYV